LRFAQDLAAFGAVEGQPRLEGRNAHVLISPAKAKEKEKEKDPKERPPSSKPPDTVQ
jgi:translation initiation factor IF-3